MFCFVLFVFNNIVVGRKILLLCYQRLVPGGLRWITRNVTSMFIRSCKFPVYWAWEGRKPAVGIPFRYYVEQVMVLGGVCLRWMWTERAPAEPSNSGCVRLWWKILECGRCSLMLPDISRGHGVLPALADTLVNAQNAFL